MTIKRNIQFSFNKVIIAVTLLLSGLLLWLHVTEPESIFVSTSTGTAASIAILAVMMLALAALLVTRQPRSVHFRLFMAFASAGLVASALYSLMYYQAGIVEFVLYIESAIIFAIEALESPQATTHVVRVKKLTTQS